MRGKIDENAYKVSGGLHGGGRPVVNALSEFLDLRIWIEGKEHHMQFLPRRSGGPAEGGGRGKRQEGHRSHFPALDRHLHQDRIPISPLWNTGCASWLSSIPASPSPSPDKRGVEPKETHLHYEGGLKAQGISGPCQAAADPRPHDDPVGKGRRHGGNRHDRNDSYRESTLAFTNNIPQRDGGTHVAGFRAGLTRVVTKYAEDMPQAKKDKVALTGDDRREGLTCVLSVKVPDPKFSSQTKDKLVSSEVRLIVEGAIIDQLGAWFEQHPPKPRPLWARWWKPPPRRGQQKARELTRRKGAGRRIASRQADCQERDPAKQRDLHRRGDSAGGSAKQAATAPTRRSSLRGKILNIERARFDKMLSSEAIVNLITALGTGIGREEFSADKLRYHKIIIMTDADVDGAHIRTSSHVFLSPDAGADRPRPYLYRPAAAL